jgi:two-component system, OmpR family, sensor kinase
VRRDGGELNIDLQRDRQRAAPTSGARAPEGDELYLAVPEPIGETSSPGQDRMQAAERQDRRVRGLGGTRSARTRILVAYVVLLALAALLAMGGFRQFLHVRLESQVENALRQEVLELDRLLTVGRDPETGRPFTSLEALFDVYFARNVPSTEEAFLGFVEGKLYRSTTLARFPLDRLPQEALADWERLGNRVPGEGESATGRIETRLGDAYFRAARIRFEDDIGAFVVTILPAEER